jgi:hypothetical protein
MTGSAVWRATSVMASSSVALQIAKNRLIRLRMPSPTAMRGLNRVLSSLCPLSCRNSLVVADVDEERGLERQGLWRVDRQGAPVFVRSSVSAVEVRQAQVQRRLSELPTMSALSRESFTSLNKPSQPRSSVAAIVVSTRRLSLGSTSSRPTTQGRLPTIQPAW